MTKLAALDVEALIDELTIPEKVSLLAGVDFWHTYPIPRLNIPKIRVSDGPNGIRGIKFSNSTPSNCFPCGTGMASTFNKELLHTAGQLMGKEARMKGAHVILGPTANIVRNPLGGRAFESFSEDPVVSGIAATAIINGIQEDGVLACMKHYVCNDQEDDRHAVNSLVTERALREIYLKPFQMAVRDSNPKSIMSAYNKVNGDHCSSSKKLLQSILREEWGWKGTVMSDWYGTYSTVGALEAGLNLEMPGGTRYRDPIMLNHMIVSKELSIDVIDTNVRQMLHFINEAIASGIPEDVVEQANESAESSEILRAVGDESIVLLKNENQVLPINKSKKQKIAVVGPNAKLQSYSGGGSASLTTRYVITPWEGIVQKVKEGGDAIELTYTAGSELNKNLPNIGKQLRKADGTPGFDATLYLEDPSVKDRKPVGTDLFTSSDILLADYDHAGIREADGLYYVDFEGTYTAEESGTYNVGCSCCGTAQIFIDDKLVVDNKTVQVKGDAYFAGLGTREERSQIELEAGKEYKFKIEFGTAATSEIKADLVLTGGVCFGIDKILDPVEELARAIELAKEADKVIVCSGLSKEWETEGKDRIQFGLPFENDKLIQEVCKVNKNVVVVSQTGSAIAMPWVDEVQGLVQAWYGGNELGNTIADVLFGDVNPSGKLPVTFPKRIADVPSYLNYASTNGEVLYGEDIFVGYRYFEKMQLEPLFAFGHGLSYTLFELSDLEVKSDGTTVSVGVAVKNTGSVAGSEVVQVYVGHENSSINKPVKELREFTKVSLQPGESKRVSLDISVKDATGYWNVYRNKWESAAGSYKVYVGNSSVNTSLEAEFEVSKTSFWLGL